MTIRAPTFVNLTALALLVAGSGCLPTQGSHECREITARTFKVKRVIDGDTFKVTYDGELASVRIIGINAPERNTPEGPAATAAMAKLIESKLVRLEFPGPRKRDNFGRLLCKVYVGDVDVGAEMIRLGQAKRYVPKR